MKKRGFSYQKIASILFIIALTVYVLIIARPLLIPLFFSMLFTLMLMPLCSFFERYINWRIPSILLSFIVALIPILGVISFFSVQLIEVFQNMPAISNKLRTGVENLINLMSDEFGIDQAERQQWLTDNFSKIIDAPITFLGEGLLSSTNVIFNLGLILLFTFFLLLYRTSFKNFILIQFAPAQRANVQSVLGKIQKMIQQYLSGMAVVMLILGVVNSTGLWLIGIRYPFFWGFLAAWLVIIPYIGTTLGGLFPFVYAIATTTTFWQPAAVVVMYASIQQIEGNFITPKIVGSSVSINPFTAILALLIGATLWGISGIILSLPVVAVLKIIFEQVPSLRPIALLMGDHLHKNRDEFFSLYDHDQNRMQNVLQEEEE